MKAKNCTGQKLQVGMVVYIEPDKRNWLQKLLNIKRRIVEVANPTIVKDIDTSQFMAGEKIGLGENGTLVSINNR